MSYKCKVRKDEKAYYYQKAPGPPLHFCEKGIKTAVRNYQREILTNGVEPRNQTMFQNGLWIFQQDSAPPHKAKTIQRWFENHVPEFISSDHWPSASQTLIHLTTNCGHL